MGIYEMGSRCVVKKKKKKKGRIRVLSQRERVVS